MLSVVRVRIVYLLSFFLAIALFVFHALVIVGTGHILVRWQHGMDLIMGNALYGVVAVVGTFLVLFVTHFVEAIAWGLFFLWLRQMDTLENAIYFAGTSLTALGYGDVVLNHPWRRLGPVMATSGILMFGCSTAFLFVVIQRVWKDV